MDVKTAADDRRWHGREIVWSWHPGADAKLAFSTSAQVTGATKPVPGEITYKR
jgi:hypothetical protein